MPKPEPKGKIQKENYQIFLEEYHPWAKEHYEKWHNNDDHREKHMLDETEMPEMSTTQDGSSIQQQSELEASVLAQHEKIQEGIKKTEAIPE
jgi:hypothetical protein